MKKTVLLNFLELSNRRNCDLTVHENGFMLDFRGKENSRLEDDSAKKPAIGKSSISSMFMLVLFFLFTNFLFAQQPVLVVQQPACNLKGTLEVMTSGEGGQNFTISPDLKNVNSRTVYKWEFVSNTSGASFVSETGQPSITINPGNIKGGINLKLTLINPASTTPGSLSRASKICSCTKSISVGNP